MDEIESKKSKIHILKSIFSHLHEVRRQKWKIGWLMILYIGTIASEPYFYKILMDGLEQELKSPVWFIPQSVIFIIAIWLIITIAAIGTRYLFAMILLKYQHADWNNFLIKSMKKCSSSQRSIISEFSMGKNRKLSTDEQKQSGKLETIFFSRLYLRFVSLSYWSSLASWLIFVWRSLVFFFSLLVSDESLGLGK